MKKRYEVKGTVDGENRNSGFCETFEQAQDVVLLFRIMCESTERDYTVKIIDTETNEVKACYES